MDREQPRDSLDMNPLHGTNGQLMAMAAHRYCLGRRSYIVGACIEWLEAWWGEFDENTRRVIVRDTVEALQDHEAGDDTDFAAWKAFAERIWARDDFTDFSCAWVKGAVAHRKREWPLEESTPDSHGDDDEGCGSSHR